MAKRLTFKAKLVLFGFGIGGMAVAGWFGWSKALRWLDRDVDQMAAILPADTPLLAVVRGPALLAPTLGDVLDEKHARNDEERARIRETKAKLTQSIGFDPTDRSAWLDSGFAFTHAIGVATHGRTKLTDTDTLVFLPVRDGAKAEATLEQRFVQEGHRVTKEIRGGRSMTVIDEGVQAWTLVGPWLLLVDADRGTGSDLLVELLDGTADPALGDDPDFRAVRRGLGRSWIAMAYVSGPFARQGAGGLGKDLELFEDRGGGISVLVTRDQIRGRVVALSDHPLEIHPARPHPDPLLRTVAGEPLALVRFNVDLPSLYDRVAGDNDMKDAVAEAERELAQEGLDLRKDVLGVLSGDGVLAILRDGSQKDVGVVAWGGLEDPARARDLVTRLAETQRGVSLEEDAEGSYAVSPLGGAGVLRTSWIAASRPWFDHIRRTPTKVEHGGVLQQLPSDVQARLESDDLATAWIDVAALQELDRGPWASLSGRTFEGWDRYVRGITAGLRVQGDTVIVDYTLYPGTEGFDGAARGALVTGS